MTARVLLLAGMLRSPHTAPGGPSPTDAPARGASALGAPVAPTHEAAPVERARYLMGTLCTAMAADPDTVRAAAALAAALDEIARLEQVMSSWQTDSEISRLNRAAAAAPVACSSDLAAVLDSALAIARMTQGAFDPTVEPLVSAWDLRGGGRLPGPAALADARERVGWPGLICDRHARTARFVRPGMGIDLGGIGKGFALDHARSTLARAGSRHALINLGGEVVTLGGPRVVTVAHPARRLSPVIEITVADAAVSTSGQSERGFTAGGVRYGHVLDPRTGCPVPTRATVTVICSSATRADALSTALLVLGRKRAAAFVRAHGGIGVLWLEPSGEAVRAWRWNLPTARAVPGAVVRWMD